MVIFLNPLLELSIRNSVHYLLSAIHILICYQSAISYLLACSYGCQVHFLDNRVKIGCQVHCSGNWKKHFFRALILVRLQRRHDGSVRAHHENVALGWGNGLFGGFQF